MSTEQAIVNTDGVVTDVILCDEDTAAQFREMGMFPGSAWVDVSEVSPRPSPGWTYTGGQFAAPATPEPGSEPEPEPEAATPPAPDVGTSPDTGTGTGAAPSGDLAADVAALREENAAQQEVIDFLVTYVTEGL